MGYTNNAMYDFLSKKVSLAIKGIAALMVLIHHFQQRTYFVTEPYVGKVLELLGYLAVSIFFFYSGYGLLISYKCKSEQYIKQFPGKRLLPFYATYLFFILVSVVVKLIIREEFSLLTLIKSFLFYDTVVTYGWYFQTILLFYIFFYIVFRIVKNQNRKIALLSVLVVMYVLICYAFSAAPAVYFSALSFVLGVAFANFDNFSKKLLQHKVITFVVSGMIFFALVVVSLMSGSRHIRHLSRVLSSPFFVTAVLIIVSVLHEKTPKILNNKITQWLGKYSLEIYFTQGVFFTIFRSKMIFISNSYIYNFAVFVCTILFSPLIYLVVKKINNLFKKNA